MNEPLDHTDERSATGIPQLDAILGGGLICHRVYLVEGEPGSGKTTLGLQYLLEGVRRGEKCLYITLSESREELTSGAASHGWSLDGIEIFELAPEAMTLDFDAQVTMYKSSEVELAETTKRLLAAVEGANPSRIVFDSLSEVRLLAQSSLRYRREILALKQFFIGRKSTVLLLDDRTSEGSDLHPQSIAHGVISLYHSAPHYGADHRKLRVIKFRGSHFRGGFHDIAIRTGGLVVFPRLVATEHSHPFTKEAITSGVAALDALLGGGPDRGTSTLLMGPAGAGKSTIALQYAVAAANRGENAVVFAFEEGLATMVARSEAIGMNLSECLQSGRIRITQMNPAEVSPGEFTSLVRYAVESEHARVIVMDSLNGYMNAMRDELSLSLQLHELLSYLGRRGDATLIVVAQHGLIGDQVQSPIDTSYLADLVVVLRYFEVGARVKKAISVIKKRSGSHEDTIREIWFDNTGIHLSEPLTQFNGVLARTPLEFESDSAHA